MGRRLWCVPGSPVGAERLAVTLAGGTVVAAPVAGLAPRGRTGRRGGDGKPTRDRGGRGSPDGKTRRAGRCGKRGGGRGQAPGVGEEGGPAGPGGGAAGPGRIGRQPRRGRRPSALRVVRVQASRRRRAARHVALAAPRLRRVIICAPSLRCRSGGVGREPPGREPPGRHGGGPAGGLCPSTVTNRGSMIRGSRPWLSSRSRSVIEERVIHEPGFRRFPERRFKNGLTRRPDHRAETKKSVHVLGAAWVGG